MHSYSICKTLVPTLPLIFHFEYFTNICRDSFGKLNISYRLSKRKKKEEVKILNNLGHPAMKIDQHYGQRE